MRNASLRSQCKNNLKQLGLALHNYHDEHGCFPPAYIADESGQPMHSWRVLILPFVEEQELYDQYRFDEPWNGPNNSKLADRIPVVYQCPSFTKSMIRFDKMTDRERRMTNYLVITGSDTAFDGAKAVGVKDILDGTSNSLAVIESRDRRVNWMQPEDVTMEELVANFRMSPDDETHVGGFHGLFFDGTVQFINHDVAKDILRAICTIAGEEAIDAWQALIGGSGV